MRPQMAQPITRNEWREIEQVRAVKRAFMEHDERLSVAELTDIVYGAKFVLKGETEEDDIIYYTLVGIFRTQQVSLVLYRSGGKLKVL